MPLTSPKGGGCVHCGFCIHGCPYGCIYNSADTVRELRAEKNFSYQRDVIVTKLRENSEKVFIEGFHRETRAPLSFEADRAYLAAGVIPTAQILLRSQNAFDRPLMLRDSQYFLFPLVLARRTRDVQSEQLYTLSQLFIELSNPKISRRSVHLQIYTYSDIIGQAVRKSLGPLKMFARQLEERMVVVQGYLHSDESPTISMTLKRDGEKDFLQLDAQPNPETRRTVKKVLRELLSQTRRLGGIVVPPMLQLAKPGRGFHSGGSIPMRENPKQFESDLLGRPHGWSRIHAVDASVLPSIPATTITFSVMANAHRIGWETATIVIFMSDKICAITGSNGYVGGCVKNYFAARGWEILELTRQPKQNSRAIKFQLGGEISPQSLAGVNALVHCAYDFKPLRRDEIRAVNVDGRKKTFSGRARGKNSKKHFHIQHQRV